MTRPYDQGVAGMQAGPALTEAAQNDTLGSTPAIRCSGPQDCPGRITIRCLRPLVSGRPPVKLPAGAHTSTPAWSRSRACRGIRTWQLSEKPTCACSAANKGSSVCSDMFSLFTFTLWSERYHHYPHESLTALLVYPNTQLPRLQLSSRLQSVPQVKQRLTNKPSAHCPQTPPALTAELTMRYTTPKTT